MTEEKDSRGEIIYLNVLFQTPKIMANQQNTVIISSFFSLFFG